MNGVQCPMFELLHTPPSAPRAAMRAHPHDSKTEKEKEAKAAPRAPGNVRATRTPTNARTTKT
jgi:hypothetical protein